MMAHWQHGKVELINCSGLMCQWSVMEFHPNCCGPAMSGEMRRRTRAVRDALLICSSRTFSSSKLVPAKQFEQQGPLWIAVNRVPVGYVSGSRGGFLTRGQHTKAFLEPGNSAVSGSTICIGEDSSVQVLRPHWFGDVAFTDCW